ncbi:hypothetical protein ACLOJK_039033, partial [Asimina triloba]
MAAVRCNFGEAPIGQSVPVRMTAKTSRVRSPHGRSSPVAIMSSEQWQTCSIFFISTGSSPPSDPFVMLVVLVVRSMAAPASGLDR